MFETIQIARYHMLRFEYPEMAADLDCAAPPAWDRGADQADDTLLGPEPEGPKAPQGQVDERELTLFSVWLVYPYY